MSGRIDARLSELGMTLPAPSEAAGNYVGFVRSGNLVFLSGQIPVQSGQKVFVGKLGREFGVAEGRKAAALAALNMFARLKAACDGDLDRVVRCVKILGFVNGTEDFVDQPQVINGASDLIVEVFGDAGRHARSAVGMASLPFGVAVEVEGVFELSPTGK